MYDFISEEIWYNGLGVKINKAEDGSKWVIPSNYSILIEAPAFAKVIV